jgi:hypothetical protein
MIGKFTQQKGPVTSGMDFDAIRAKPKEFSMSATILPKDNANGQGSFADVLQSTEPESQPTPRSRLTDESPAPDPFDPASLRLSQDFASSIGVKRVLTRIRCGKPEKHEFVRVRPGEEWRLETYLLELKGSQDKPGQETYLVQPSFVPDLLGEVRPAVLFCAINRQKVPFLWRCWLPSTDGRANLWTDTLLDAARLAERKWIRVVAGAGQYDIAEAAGQLSEPEWPDLSFREWIELAFKDRNITSLDHPVIRSLRGEI